MKSTILLLASLVLAPLCAQGEELIVKMKPRASFSTLAAQEIMAKTIRTAANGKFLVVEGDRASISRNPSVEYAEPNIKIRVPREPLLRAADPMAWGVSKISADKVWEKGITGKGVIVAVIDTGVDYTHPALKGKVVLPVKDAKPEDCTGWNFANKVSDPMDDQGHGTHVSGTIAGDGVGVAPGAKILGVKFLDKDGSGTLEDALSAIQYAIDCKVNVMSNSWGGGGKMQSMQDLINAAHEKGMIFVAASGNSYRDNDSSPSYPASYDNVISVAATDNKDLKANFSNYGAKSVHVAAPGVNVYSLAPGGKYASMSGTSMATPHVSGVVALMLEAKIPADQIRQKMVDSFDVVSPAMKIVSKGRLNALKAVY